MAGILPYLDAKRSSSSASFSAHDDWVMLTNQTKGNPVLGSLPNQCSRGAVGVNDYRTVCGSTLTTSRPYLEVIEVMQDVVVQVQLSK